jgi:hypothetical protein
MSTFIAAFSTAFSLAVCSGIFEAYAQRQRIARNNRRKLNHDVLTLIRASVIIPVAGILAHWSFWDAAILVAFMAMAFTPVHRAVKNRCSGVKTWYMGPSIRASDDSSYDSIWWVLSAYRIETYWNIDGRKRSRYYVYSERLPFIICTCVETCATFLFWAWLLNP